jgi:ATP-binding cassette, subfamily B, bacterial
MQTPLSAKPALGTPSVVAALAAPWSAMVYHALEAEEVILATLQPDLNDSLHAASGLVLLTDQRLLAWAPGQGAAPTAPQAWALHPGLQMQLTDHAGVGALSLMDGEHRQAVWRFTLGVNLHAQRLVAQFTQAVAALAHPPGALAAEETPADDTDESPRFPPGRCCAFGALPALTNGNCWPAFC